MIIPTYDIPIVIENSIETMKCFWGLELAFEVVDDGDYIEGGETKINRSDVARYMMKVLQDESTHQKFHAISIKK